MVPDFSEFSYGFAVTREYTLDPTPTRAVPIFPTQFDEGQTGGGYDVQISDVLATPGVPVFFNSSGRNASRGHLRAR